MSDIYIDKIFNSVYDILEIHATFISKGQNDENYYFIPIEILEILVWISLKVVLPILLGVTTAIVSNKLLKKNDKITKALELKQSEIDKLKAEVKLLIKNENIKKKPKEDSIKLAKASLAELLIINGWPTTIAKKDAEKSVNRIHHQFWIKE